MRVPDLPWPATLFSDEVNPAADGPAGSSPPHRNSARRRHRPTRRTSSGTLIHLISQNNPTASHAESEPTFCPTATAHPAAATAFPPEIR
jgi:hypothetical protein